VGCDVWMYGCQPDAQLQQECVDWIDTEPPGAPWPVPVFTVDRNFIWTYPVFTPTEQPFPFEFRSVPEKLRSEYENAFTGYESTGSAAFVRLDQLRLSRHCRFGFDCKCGPLVSGWCGEDDQNPTGFRSYVTNGVQWRVPTGDPRPYLFAHALRTHFIPNLQFEADYDVELFEELIHELGLHEQIQSADLNALNSVLEKSVPILGKRYHGEARYRKYTEQEEKRRKETLQEVVQHFRNVTPDCRQIRIEDLAVHLTSLRLINFLEVSGGITTLGELASLTEQQVRTFRNVGDTTVDEIAELLQEFGLEFQNGTE